LQVLVVATIIGASLGAFAIARSAADREVAQTKRHEAETAVDALVARTTGIVAKVSATAAAFATAGTADATAFSTISYATLMPEQPVDVRYSQRVAGAMLTQFTIAHHLALHGITAAGAAYDLTLFAEPPPRHGLIGTDLSGDPAVATAVDAVVYAGGARASATTTLADGRPGFVTIAPVRFADGSSGFVTASFALDDLTRFTWSPTRRAQATLLGDGAPVPPGAALATADAAGHELRVAVRNGRGTTLTQMLPWIVLGGGLALAGLVATILAREHRRRVAAQLLAISRADELARASALIERVTVAVDEFLYSYERRGGRWEAAWESPNWWRPLGRRVEGSREDAWRAAVHADDRARFLALRDRAERGEATDEEFRIVGSDGGIRWLRIRESPRVGADGTITVDGVSSDITESKHREAELEDALTYAAEAFSAMDEARAQAELQSRTDALTGVANRRHLAEELEAALADLAPTAGATGLVLLDIDRFKQVNDTLGHQAGDAVLVAVAARIGAVAAASGTVARWGGEEFAVLVRDAPDDRALRALAEAIRLSLASEPMVLATGARTVTASVGVARAVAGTRPDELVRDADAALYAAKRRGRNTVRLASELTDRDLLEEAPESIAIASAMALAASVREGMPMLHCQQVADLSAEVAIALGLPAPAVLQARLAGWLHDVGKVAIPDAILAKPGPLTEEEWVVMRSHTAIGEQLVLQVPGLLGAGAAVRHHHERLDGTGYPDALAGAAIPLEARIVAAVDAYSAITSDRVYAHGRERDEALAELRRSAGTHLDPVVVEALIGVLAARDAAFRNRLDDAA
jgi:diguanylate cyclase (GGDEF)-like protein